MNPALNTIKSHHNFTWRHGKHARAAKLKARLGVLYASLRKGPGGRHNNAWHHGHTKLRKYGATAHG